MPLQLTAERLQEAFAAALLPADVLQVAHISPHAVATLVQDTRVDFISFTGSVSGGQSVAREAVKGKGFPGVALEVCEKWPLCDT